MTDTIPPDQHPIDLPTYLLARRDALMHIWRTACANDKSLHIGAGLSREEFNDQIPTVLDLFGEQLRLGTAESGIGATASEHGLHRWHKGYSLHELLAELSHFSQCLTAEMSAYQRLYPGTDPALMAAAYELVVRFSSWLVGNSTIKYNELQRSQAAERAELLQQALDQVAQVTRQRGELLRMTSHDLRGGFGVIQGAASLLDLSDQSDPQWNDRLKMLRRNMLSVGSMLRQLTDLARLEAGQEIVSIKPVDVGELLRSIVDSAQPLVAERNLTLRADGPETLVVETDALMVQRIVQNLLLNALQHTKSGLISVSWSKEDNYRWTVSVQDTGTGLPESLAASLTIPLKPTPESASVLENDSPKAVEPTDAGQPMQGSKTGEGIGLYIVKWLCQLLNASIDIETCSGQGTLFRVRMPVHGSQE